MERPILFNGEMVKAILEGRKTQTRRIIKTRIPVLDSWKFETCVSSTNSKTEGRHCFGNQKGVQREGIDHTEYFKSPYGYPGDRLWVKETWRGGTDTLESVWYKASDECALKYGHCQCSWKPSIFMPRDYSRIDLEIVNVRVERLQDISEEDAKSEGVDWTVQKAGGYVSNGYYRSRFSILWESINGSGSWDKNPWVWVIEFRRIT